MLDRLFESQVIDKWFKIDGMVHFTSDIVRVKSDCDLFIRYPFDVVVWERIRPGGDLCLHCVDWLIKQDRYVAVGEGFRAALETRDKAKRAVSRRARRSAREGVGIGYCPGFSPEEFRPHAEVLCMI